MRLRYLRWLTTVEYIVNNSFGCPKENSKNKVNRFVKFIAWQSTQRTQCSGIIYIYMICLEKENRNIFCSFRPGIKGTATTDFFFYTLNVWKVLSSSFFFLNQSTNSAYIWRTWIIHFNPVRLKSGLNQNKDEELTELIWPTWPPHVCILLMSSVMLIYYLEVCK